MPTQLIVNMGQKYPFGKCEQCKNTTTKIMIKKTLNTGKKNENLAKAKFLKGLNLPNIIKIQSIFQQEDSVSILYEYIPLKFQTWMTNINTDLIQKIIRDLQELSNVLSDNGVNVNFCVDRIGFSSDYRAKYFLGLDFKILTKQNSVGLKQKYYREITLMMRQGSVINQNRLKKQLFISLKENSEFKSSFFKNINLNGQQKKKLLKTPSLGSLQKIFKNQNTKIKETLFNQEESFENKNHTKQSAQTNNLNITLDQYKRQHQSKPKLKYQTRLKTQQTSSSHYKKDSSTIKDDTFKHKREEPANFINPADYFSYYDKQKKQKSQIKKKNAHTKHTFLSQKSVFRDQKEKGSKTPSKFRNTLEQSGSILVSKKQLTKSMKSQENTRTPKNSQSPIQYVQIIKSNEQYIQDFLNVLQNSLQQQQSLQVQLQDVQKRNSSGNIKLNKGERQETQESEQKSQLNSPISVKWKNRVTNVIQNSKKLIGKFRSPKKTLDAQSEL